MTKISVSEILQRTVVVLARTPAGVRRAVAAPARLLPVAAAVVEAAQAVYAMLRVHGRRVVLAADRCDGLEMTAPVAHQAAAVVAARLRHFMAAESSVPSVDIVGQLTALVGLHDAGCIDDDEFYAAKKLLLAMP